MFNLDLNVEGLSELMKNLEAFTEDIRKNALTKALVDGANVIADEMAAEAPESNDESARRKWRQHLGETIVVNVEENPIGSDAEVYVGPSKRGSSRASWMEFGVPAHAITVEHMRVLASTSKVFGTHVQHPGLRPRPFIRPALDAAGPDAVEAVKQSLTKSVAEATKRAAK